MEAHQRVIFIAVLMAFFISIYVMGEALNKFLWSKYIVLSLRVQTKQAGPRSAVGRAPDS